MASLLVRPIAWAHTVSSAGKMVEAEMLLPPCLNNVLLRLGLAYCGLCILVCWHGDLLVVSLNFSVVKLSACCMRLRRYAHRMTVAACYCDSYENAQS